MNDPALHLFDLLTWRLRRALPGLRAGAQRGSMRGSGDTFADLAPLLAHPDPRRIDLRRSLLDPMGGLFVRRFETQTDLTLHLLLDASASLATGARSDRPGLAGLLVAGFARAAWRGRDRFALSVCAGPKVLLAEAPTRRRGLDAEVLDHIGAVTFEGDGIEALVSEANQLPSRRVLVVLISDFELAEPELDRLLAALAPRPLLPVWLRDTGLEAPPGHLGLAETRDPETGRRRTVLTTRAWAGRQADRGAAHRAKLCQIFADYGHAPIEIRDQIDVEAIAAALGQASL